MGIALDTTTSLPLGSMEIRHMFPLDFEEFLIANGVGELALGEMKRCFLERRSLDRFLGNKDYDVNSAIVLSNGKDVYVRDGITYLPVYFVMFMEPSKSDSATEVTI